MEKWSHLKYGHVLSRGFPCLEHALCNTVKKKLKEMIAPMHRQEIGPRKRKIPYSFAMMKI